ncbi:MAG: TIGR00341 family protein [bacterium]|nr:TIGR00341 family protein [bacterium]
MQSVKALSTLFGADTPRNGIIMHMPLLAHFRVIGDKDKTRAVRKMVEDSTPDFDYFFLLVLAVLMSTFGLLAGSETIVIGAMLIAPLLAPVLGLALGTSMSDHPLIYRSLSTIGYSIALSIVTAIAVSFLFSSGDLQSGFNDAILDRTEPSLLYFVVAVISGFAVAYTSVRQNLSSTLPGIAVAVALLPPLAVFGIGIAHLSQALVAGSAVMFLINVAGIVFAAMVTFSLMDVHHKKFIAESTIKREEKLVEEENEKIEAIEKKDGGKASDSDSENFKESATLMR